MVSVNSLTIQQDLVNDYENTRNTSVQQIAEPSVDVRSIYLIKFLKLESLSKLNNRANVRIGNANS